MKSESLAKNKIVKYLVWDEKSLRARRQRDRGAAVCQVEKLYVLTCASEELAFPYKSRKHYEGSNRGDVLGPIVAPSWKEARLRCYEHVQLSRRFLKNDRALRTTWTLGA